jgi:hypothetical protein
MEQYSILRVSVSSRNCTLNGAGEVVDCTQTDTLTIQDKLIFMGKISVAVMPETETLDPGCYLFMEYGDAEGVSAEYVKNLTLLEERYRDYYFSLDFTEPGKVYLCVTTYQVPVVQRYVDLPAMEGITYNYVMVNGARAIHKIGRNYVRGHQDFSVNLTWTGVPLKTWARGTYSFSEIDLDPTSVGEDDGSVTYTIRQVVEPWTVFFGPQSSTGTWVGNETLLEQHVWTHRNALYINVPTEDVVSIYNMTGVLNRKVEIPAGLNKMTLDKGVYVVTLKDGKVYKIVIN